MLTRRSLLAAAFVTANCGRYGRKTIAVIPKANADLFFLSIRAGALDAARQLHVEMVWNGPDRETEYDRQIQIVDVMIARRVDALAISATDDRALLGPLQRVARAGIPITIFDSAINIDNYVSMIATDNYGAGCVAARQLARLVHATGTVAMLKQKPGGRSTELREQGFHDTLAKEFPHVEIVAEQFGMGDRARSMALAENILTAHQDLAGIFASSEAGSIGSIRALRSRRMAGQVKLVTFDVSDIHLEALKDGTANVMLVQDAFRIGYEAVKSLADKLAGATPAKKLDIPARIVTAADIANPELHRLLHPAQESGL